LAGASALSHSALGSCQKSFGVFDLFLMLVAEETMIFIEQWFVVGSFWPQQSRSAYVLKRIDNVFVLEGSRCVRNFLP
jgi:hypothetical protein